MSLTANSQATATLSSAESSPHSRLTDRVAAMIGMVMEEVAEVNEDAIAATSEQTNRQ